MLAGLLLSLTRADAASAACVAVPAGPLAPSTFEGGDGDQCDSGAGRTDWQNIANDPALEAVSDEPEASIFTDGNEETPSDWNVGPGSIGGPKYNALGAWSFTEPVTANTFLYLSFKREADSGTTFLGFELNQLKPDYTNDNGFTGPRRSDGDLLISYNIDGSILIGVCKWDGTAGQEHKSGVWRRLDGVAIGGAVKDCTPVSSPTAQAALNGLDIPAAENWLEDNTVAIPDGQFAEASVNLSLALGSIANANPCFNFGSVWVHSRSSQPVNSSMKDYLEPRPIVAASCAAQGYKKLDANGDGALAGAETAASNGLNGFRMYVDYNGNDVWDSATEPSDVTHDDPSGNPGYYLIDDVTNGVYAVREHLSATQVTDGWTCTVPASCEAPVAFDGGLKNGPTFGNFRPGKIEIVKDVVGNAGGDTFNLKLDAATVKTNAADGDSSGERIVAPGSFTVSEDPGTAPAGTDLADYTTGIVCKAGNGTGATVASGSGASLANVPVGAGDDVVCTVTNTRRQGKLEVVKDVVGNGGDDTFTLRVDGVDKKLNAGDGDSTGELAYDTGSYTVSEVAGTAPAGTNLSDYVKKIVCVDGATTVAQTTIGQDLATLTVPVGHNADVVCTVTNEREQGKLEVVKDVVGSAGDDTFNLRVGSDVVKENAVDGDSSGELVRDTGSYTVSELAGTAPAGTDLGDYQKKIVCVDGQTTVVETTPGQDLSTLSVPVGHNSDVVCTITNEREQGKLEVVKDVVGNAGGDTFNLRVDGDVEKENAGDGDSTGELTYDTGSYTVSEVAGTAPAGTNLDWYTKKVVCVDGAATVAQTTPGQDLATLNVPVGHNADVVCTITNDLEEGTLRVEKQTDPDETNGETFGFTTSAGAGFSLADDQVESRTVRPGSFTVTEGTKSGYRLQGIACDDANSTGSTGTRTATFDIGPGENVKCTFTNTKLNASAVVVKAGNEFAYHGDQVTYTFVVTNPGNSPLTDVTVTDDKCAPVTGPDKQVDGGDANALDPGDRWVYSCTTTIGSSHDAGEQNPRINTVTVAAKDEQGRPVEAKDDHATKLLHPGIGIDKSGPASAVAGQPVDFGMVVTNTGDVAFTEGFVAVRDPRCEAPPALTGKNGDATPVTLDPGDRWSYSCRVQTADGQTEVVNTATVTGTDPNGRQVSAQDTVRTPLTQPVRQVAASRRASPGAARLLGPSGCVTRPFTVRIRGREIQRVAFYVGKKRIRTLTAKASQNGREQVLSFRIDPRDLRRGKVHRVSARVTFTTVSGTRSRTLRLAFQRCRAAVKPKFTG